MIILALIATAIAVALVFLLAIFYALRKANELTKEDCGNCKCYDRTLHTCWPKFETRFPGDKACDFFQKREDYEG